MDEVHRLGSLKDSAINEAKKILADARKEKLPIVDAEGNLIQETFGFINKSEW